VKPKKILCVCIGNSDRSPVMAAVLQMFLTNAGDDVSCGSAGIGENAAKGGPPAPFAVEACRRIGIDIASHNKLRITSLNLADYDLIVCANDEIAGQVIQAGGDMKKIYNAQITNATGLSRRRPAM
jgi:protein-tyrosine-phosphatase